MPVKLIKVYINPWGCFSSQWNVGILCSLVCSLLFFLSLHITSYFAPESSYNAFALLITAHVVWQVYMSHIFSIYRKIHFLFGLRPQLDEDDSHLKNKSCGFYFLSCLDIFFLIFFIVSCRLLKIEYPGVRNKHFFASYF